MFSQTPSGFGLMLAVFLLLTGGLLGFLIWLITTRSQGDLGLSKKANRFKDLDFFLAEGKRAYRQNEELRDLYAVARTSGAKRKFFQGLIAAGERGGNSASEKEGALWLSQAIALDPNSAEAYFRLGKTALSIGNDRGENRYLRVAHQAFTKAFLLRRGHVQAFEHLIMMSCLTDRIYGQMPIATEPALQPGRASRVQGDLI